MQEGFSFGNFLLDVIVVFGFVLWLWLLFTVMGDLFRRRDVSGVSKVIWIICLIVLPYLGVFVYLVTQGGSMAERHEAQAVKWREEIRSVVGFSAADELKKLDELKAKGSLSEAEYLKMRARLI